MWYRARNLAHIRITIVHTIFGGVCYKYTYDYWYHTRKYAPEKHECQPVLHFFTLLRYREWISSSSHKEENVLPIRLASGWVLWDLGMSVFLICQSKNRSESQTSQGPKEPNLKPIWLVTHAHTHWSVFSLVPHSYTHSYTHTCNVIDH